MLLIKEKFFNSFFQSFRFQRTSVQCKSVYLAKLTNKLKGKELQLLQHM